MEDEPARGHDIEVVGALGTSCAGEGEGGDFEGDVLGEGVGNDDGGAEEEGRSPHCFGLDGPPWGGELWWGERGRTKGRLGDSKG